MPVQDPKYAPSSALANPVLAPSPYWGTEQIWDTQVNAHNPMMDQDGRVYFTAQTRSPKDPPEYCKRDSPLRSAQLYPLAGTPDGFVQNARQITVYDPEARRSSHSSTPASARIISISRRTPTTRSGSATTRQGNLAVVGWINTKMYLETGDAAKSQGWTALIVDTNGNGKRDEGYNEPGRAARLQQGHPHPVRLLRHRLVAARRLALGLEPRASRLHPAHGAGREPARNRARGNLQDPAARLRHPRHGRRPQRRRVGAARFSGHIGSFDRTLCKGPLNGPGAELGNKCPEGWEFYPIPGPGFQGDSGAAENPYYTWVDQHNILGLGANMPIATGNQSDSLHALVGGAMIELRVPYPDGLLRQGPRRPHRRSECRLEGPRPLGDVGQPHAGPYRRHRCAAPGRARHDREDAHRARWWCTSSCAPIRWRIELGISERRVSPAPPLCAGPQSSTRAAGSRRCGARRSAVHRLCARSITNYEVVVRVLCHSPPCILLVAEREERIPHFPKVGVFG